MYTQFFGNYLLMKNAITSEQFLDALRLQTTSHIKLGALAVHSGFMTGSEVENVFILQTHQDRRFGEIAVEEGYLTEEQVASLLEQQVPDFVLLGQILVEQHIFTPKQLEELVADYQSEYEIFDLDIAEEKKETVNRILQNFFHSENMSSEFVIDYLTLLFHNLIRFIGEDFTPLNIIELAEVPTNFCTSQRMDSAVFHVESALDMDPQTSITFASRYIGEKLEDFDEYAKSSMEDFLNLHNGLFIVNMSNEYSMEIQLQPPSVYDNTIFAPGKISYLLPIMYPFGTIHFIWSAYTIE